MSLTPLYTTAQIRRRVKELAMALDERFGKHSTPHLIGVLKGGFVFLADLMRAMSRPTTVDFVRVESYNSATTSSGTPQLIESPSMNLRNRDVVIVEDIVDTGLTLETVRQHLLTKQPRSLSTVALLDKQARRQIDVPLDLVGFRVGDEFIVGYGLDINEMHRELSYLTVVAR